MTCIAYGNYSMCCGCTTSNPIMDKVEEIKAKIERFINED